ncbi:MAG: molybdopterin-synthase adenylyltransferase MoeB [Candidatus Omnitrophica bacterium]|nr:molybdopterin-synthase adenylyltransferase MoeB [Candidatus Omnitrophota bacterium]
MDAQFSQSEKVRYSRQTILPQFGLTGQTKLKNARVLFVGAGGLGSAPAIYLAAAGVGTIGLIDPDKVSLSNLHRQILHFTPDVDKPKVVSASEKLTQINPNVKIVTYQERLTVQNAQSIIDDYDVVIDGTDNLPSRYLINDACFFLKKNFIFGGVYQFEGQVSVFGASGPCYRCIFREMPSPEEMPSCVEAGVIGVIPGIIGLMQANEAIKGICGMGESLLGRLLIFDALSACWREVKIKNDPECPLCGAHPTIKKLEEYSWECASGKMSQMMLQVSVRELKELRDKNPDLYLLDVREQEEWDVDRIEGAHLKPMSQLQDNYQDIPKDKPVYCYCHAGGRSARVVGFLKSQGYENVYNVIGGMQAWSEEIDSPSF